MTDYATLQRRRNMIVGGFVLVALCAFVWMLMMFGDLPITVNKLRSYEILIKFPTAPGIGRDTPVQYCGYQIGRVLNVSPPILVKDPNGTPVSHEIRVTCLIQEHFVDIPWNVDIKLMRRGLGSSFIEFIWHPNTPLVRKDPADPRSVFLKDKMVLSGTTGMSSEFFPPEVQEKLENLVDSISALTINANDIIGDEQNKTNIHKTLVYIGEATAQARDTLKSLQKFSDIGGDQLVRITDRLDQSLAEFNKVLVQINQGEGTAGQILNDDRLYQNLVESTMELQLALEQIKKWASEARDKGVRLKMW